LCEDIVRRKITTMRCLIALFISLLVSAAHACETALILTFDVSNSVDPAEYLVQSHGLADALLDPDVIEAMVQGSVAIMVVQWSGADRQEISIPWTRVRTALDVERLSQAARLMPRAIVLSDTAPAEAIRKIIRELSQALG